ncbi:MAG TPA: IS3 family transposase [Acidimicrobiales bacterium]|nr:IS3 family transposase [Acidimicrobiales bacterium]
MQGKRTKFKADFKAKVALEALKGDKSTAELAQIYGVHPTQITQWKKLLLDQAPSVFEGRHAKADTVDVDELYKKIGKLEMERDFLASARGEWSSELRRQMIDPDHALPVSRQCALLDVARSTYYYERGATESEENLELMRLIDEIYLAHPENGQRMMVRTLKRRGIFVNRKRVRRLMRLMGLKSLAPQPKTTVANRAHPVYPYLLRDLVIDHPNQVWAADITYVPFRKGFWYLVAIMDWHSRKVLSWRLSNTMTSDFCVAALHEALALYGTPEIFNTDQGAQFTSDAFTSVLKDAGVKISMDGVGRAIDNVFIERLWRTLKYDHLYLNPAENGSACRAGIAAYLRYYNEDRPHSSLGDATPDEVYYQSKQQQRVA